MDSFWHFLTEYWAQITVLVMALGWIIQTLVNWNLKKSEIKYSALHQQKLHEVKEFYQAYIGLHDALHGYLIKTAEGKDELKTEMRIKTIEKFRDLRISFQCIRLFVPDEDLPLFDDIKRELGDAFLEIDYFNIDKSFDAVDRETVKKLRHVRDVVFPKKLPELLSKVEASLRKHYQQK